MNSQAILFLPNHITLRRYEEVNIYDLEQDESYIIDDEAFAVLKLVDGKRNSEKILHEFPEDKRDEVQEALEQFYDLEIIQQSFHEISDDSVINIDHVNLPKKNPFKAPYLKNLMINITERCNLTCKHCYIPDKNLVDMPLGKLQTLIKEFYDLQGIRIILTGGEPFLYGQFKELLEWLRDIPIQKVILSNGTLIKDDPEIMGLLKTNHFEIYVSIDGLEATHNGFRDAKCFGDTVDGIIKLLENGVEVSINTMVHKQNLGEFDGLYKMITSLGTIKNWAIDIPTFDDSTAKEIREKYEITPEEGGAILKDFGWGVIFESIGGTVYYACGPHLMAIDVTGVVTKCGFFTEQSPGNINELGLKSSWEKIQKDLNWCIDDLKCLEMNCEFLDECRGGCRYRGYKNSGNLLGIDAYKCYQFGKKIE